MKDDPRIGMNCLLFSQLTKPKPRYGDLILNETAKNKVTKIIVLSSLKNPFSPTDSAEFKIPSLLISFFFTKQV